MEGRVNPPAPGTEPGPSRMRGCDRTNSATTTDVSHHFPDHVQHCTCSASTLMVTTSFAHEKGGQNLT
jgi:hypothetical protein